MYEIQVSHKGRLVAKPRVADLRFLMSWLLEFDRAQEVDKVLITQGADRAEGGWRQMTGKVDILVEESNIEDATAKLIELIKEYKETGKL